MALSMTDLDEVEKLVRDVVQEEIKNLPSKEEFFRKMDEVMGELRDEREEQVVLSGQSNDHSDRLEVLEKIHPGGRHASVA